MSNLIQWMNQEVRKMREDLDTLYERMYQDFSSGTYEQGLFRSPQFTLEELEDRIIVSAPIAGFSPDDLHIALTERELIVRGEITIRVASEKGHLSSVQTFSQRIHLPCMVKRDEVVAVYEQGVLTITLPKDKNTICRIDVK